jgi:hypothetical protein
MNFVPTQRIATYIAISVCLLLLTASYTLAKVGVGMGAGEIRVTEDIRPGGIYTLPALRVFNTGDETTTYGMNVAYHQDNVEVRPAKSWFAFSPSTFTLEPGKSEEISVVMTVPVKAVPGEYFAFLESGPVQSRTEGTSVGVAVATKLYFTVVPANLLQAFMHRTTAFMHAYAPWTWISLGVFVVFMVGYLFTRFFSFNISFRSKKKVP